MCSIRVLIPSLDSRGPDALKIAVVTSRNASLQWHRFTQELAAVGQPGVNAELVIHAVYHGRVGSRATAKARCGTTAGRCSSAGWWRRTLGLGMGEPFADSGYLLSQAIAPGGLWIADYS